MEECPKVLSCRHNVASELRMAVVTCARFAQDQASEKYGLAGGGAVQAPPFPRSWWQFIPAKRGRIILFGAYSHW